MIKKKTMICTVVCTGVLLLTVVWFVGLMGERVSAQQVLTPMEELGKFLFFDENLSEPGGQACASCHHPSSGFAEPDQSIPVSEGVIPGRFGNRNSPSAAYAAYTPVFDPPKTLGGQFWDGRAANLVEQAKGPFLNPKEMNNPDKAAVVGKVAAASYAYLFEQVFGPNAFTDIDTAYHNVATAIAAFEASTEVNTFSSKYDAYLAGLVNLTPEEALGEKLFNGKAKCHHCHPTKVPGSDPMVSMAFDSHNLRVHPTNGAGANPVVLTDFDYHNIGLPQNTEYPFTPPIPIDLGLGGITLVPNDYGKFKTPHLRNISLTAPYMHNGLLKTLKDVVHFYNTRDVPGMWDPPEVPGNLDTKFMGNLGLTDEEENVIVIFMLTFDDGYM